MEKKPYKRHTYIINKKFQVKYLFIIITVMLITVATVSFTTFYFVWDRIIEEFFFVPDAAKKLGHILVNTTKMLVLPVIVLAVVFAFAGVLLSHRVAGPIYRVQKIAEDLGNGNLNFTVRFRKDDDLQELAGALNKMIGNIRAMVKEDKVIISRLSVMSEKLSRDIDSQQDLKKDVRETVAEIDRIVKLLKQESDKFQV